MADKRCRATSRKILVILFWLLLVLFVTQLLFINFLVQIGDARTAVKMNQQQNRGLLTKNKIISMKARTKPSTNFQERDGMMRPLLKSSQETASTKTLTKPIGAGGAAGTVPLLGVTKALNAFGANHAAVKIDGSIPKKPLGAPLGVVKALREKAITIISKQPDGASQLGITKAALRQIGLRERNKPVVPTYNTVQILFGLSGDDPGFINEFEVALKSVLLNAPLDADLAIHILADQTGYLALDGVFARSELSSWRTRNQIFIFSYNIQPLVPDIRKMRNEFLIKVGLEDRLREAERHTVGAWFRLYAHKVLPDNLENVIYLDTDAAVFANLQKLWRNIGSDSAFHMGESRCSGFMALNLKMVPSIWEMAGTIDVVGYMKETQYLIGDQLVLRAAGVAHPQLEGRLPPEWDVSMIGQGTLRNVTTRNDVLEERPQIGMMHFNGGAKSKEEYYNQHRFLTNNSALDDTLGLVKYYVHMPWRWARFMALSRTRDGQGHHLMLNHIPLPPAKVTGPVFMLSFYKSGTAATHRFFHCGLGERASAHKRIPHEKSKNRLAKCMEANNATGRPLVEGCGNYTVFTSPGDMWVDRVDQDTSKRKCFLPGIHGLENIATHYPDATIMLLKRNSTNWVRSIPTGFLRKLSSWCEGVPPGAYEATTRETIKLWSLFFRHYIETIQKFARDNPSMTFIELELESSNIGEMMEERTGIPESCWEY